MWKCHFLEDPPMKSHEFDGKVRHYIDYPQWIGAMWYARNDEGKPLTLEEAKQWHLTAYYFQNNSWRPPLVVTIPCIYTTGPGVSTFHVDSQCYDDNCTQCGQRSHNHWDYSNRPEDGKYKLVLGHVPTSRGYYDGWTVTGKPPDITVSPSINYVGSYHGWLQNGVISQDVDGRNYTLPGKE